jgi:hypothetical protein
MMIGQGVKLLTTSCEQTWLEQVGNTTTSRTQLQVLDAVRQLPGCSLAPAAST